MGKRVFWIVLDSAGIGGAPDAADFGDAGADTFGSCYKSGEMNVPVMEKLGIRNIKDTSFYDPKEDIDGCFCRMHEKSRGKDTTVGHWEMAGMVSPKPLPTYYEGFPQEILDKLSKATGRNIVCNKTYSGTDVIRDYGKHHVETGEDKDHRTGEVGLARDIQCHEEAQHALEEWSKDPGKVFRILVKFDE